MKKSSKMNFLKSTKGSITLYVLLSSIFFLTLSAGTYVGLNNRQQEQEQEIKRVQKMYEQIYVDDMGPHCTISKNPDEDPTSAEKIVYTMVWDEELEDKTFTVDDIEVTNGTIVGFSSVTENRVYKVTVKYVADGEQMIKVPDSCCTDTDGNPNYGVSLTTNCLDRKIPTVQFNPNGATASISINDRGTFSTIITASDIGSGLKTLEYAWSTSKTKEPTSWNAFTSGASVEMTSDKGSDIANEISTGEVKKTYYLWTRVLDNAGNRGEEKVSNAFIVTVPRINVTYSSNYESGGNARVDSKLYGEKLGALPTTSRVGYAFNGKWYTETSGGNEITENSLAPNTNVTYYAHWDEAHYAIDDTSYAVTLNEALGLAKNGSIIKAIKNYTDSSDVSIDKNVTITPNGYTITRTKQITINSGITATFTGNGTIQSNSGTKMNLIYNNGTANINMTGKITKQYTGADDTNWTIYNNGTCSIREAGEISSSGKQNIFSAKNSILNISNGTISSKNGDTAIWTLGTTNISKGTISSSTGAALRVDSPGTVEISGGTINGQNAILLGNSNEGGAYGGTLNITGGTVAGTNNGIWAPAGTLNITSGNITGTKNGIYACKEGNAVGTATITIGEAGSDTPSVTEPVINGDTEYGIYVNTSTNKFTFNDGKIVGKTAPAFNVVATCIENYYPITYYNSDKGNFYTTLGLIGKRNYSIDITPETYTENLYHAVACANSTGSTIKALQNVTDDSEVEIAKSLTISMNAKTITRSAVITINSGYTVSIDGSGTITSATLGKLIINNGTLKLPMTGTINSTLAQKLTNNLTNEIYLIESYGTIEKTGSGTISTNNKGLYVDGNATISNGTIRAKGVGVQSTNAVITVSGGTIEGTNETAIYVNSRGKSDFTMTGGTLKSNNEAIRGGGASNGKISISGGTITATNGSAISANMTGTVNITGNTVITAGTNAITKEAGGNLTVTLGVNSDPLSTTAPEVNANTNYGIIADTIYFYNGIIKGTREIPYSAGTITPKTGYEVLVYEDGSQYCAVLGGINYKIEHYVMNTTGNYPGTATSTEIRKGSPLKTITLADCKKMDAGYNVENGIKYKEGKVNDAVVTTTNISSDGSTVIKLYYERTYGTLTTEAGNNIASVTEQNARRYYYGATVPSLSATCNSEVGYTIAFSKWSSSNTTYIGDSGTSTISSFTWPAMPTGTAIKLRASATKTANGYTVTYQYNNATSGNTVTDKPITYGNNYGTLPSPGRAYTVTFNANGGNVSIDSTTASYTFGGWYKETSYTNEIQSTTIVTTANSHTIYAKWTGGTISLPTPTRAGHTFDGWYTSASGGTNVTTSTKIESEQTIYAHWTINKWTVAYNANGGSGAPSSQTKTYGVDLTLSSTKPTRTEYVFKGWATSSTGSATYQPGGTYSANAGVTLYAVWAPAHYAVDNTIYTETLQEAVSVASSGSTIKAIADYTDSSTVSISKNLTLSANGHTITRTKRITVNSGYTVTLNGTGTITYNTTTSDHLFVNYGTLNVAQSGKISNDVSGSNTGSIIYNEGTCNISAGTTHSEGCKGVYNVKSTSKVNITGGTIETNSDVYSSVYIDAGTVTMASAALKANYGHCLITNGGTFTMTSGTMTASEATSCIDLEDGTVNINGGTVSTVNVNSTGTMYVYQKNGTFNITGATMDGDAYYGHYCDGSGTSTYSNATVTAGVVLLLRGTSSGVVNSGTYNATLDAGLSTQDNSNLTLRGGTVNAKTAGIYCGSEGRFTMTEGNVTGETDGILFNEAPTIEVTGGTITGRTGLGIGNGGTGEYHITIGSSSADISTTNPLITGGLYGIHCNENSAATIYLNNGKVQGKLGACAVQPVLSTRTLVDGQSGEYYTKYVQ